MTHFVSSRTTAAIPQICDWDGCTAIAIWEPVVLFFRKAEDPLPLEGEVAVVLCNTHKGMIQIDDVVTPARWAKFCTTFDALGRARPAKNLTRIKGRVLGVEA